MMIDSNPLILVDWMVEILKEDSAFSKEKGG